MQRQPSFKFEPAMPAAAFPDSLRADAARTSPNSLLKVSSNSMEIFGVFHSLHLLSIALDDAWIGVVDRMPISNLMHEIEYTLLCLPSYHSDRLALHQEMVSDAMTVIEALTIGAQIFLYGAVRLMPLSMRIFDIFLSRLLKALDGPDLLGLWASECTIDALLWTLSMGAVAAQKRPAMPWLMDNLMLAMRQAGVHSQNDYNQRLKALAWTDEFCASTCAMLWAAAALGESGSA
jgi:hypothetical protein